MLRANVRIIGVCAMDVGDGTNNTTSFRWRRQKLISECFKTARGAKFANLLPLLDIGYRKVRIYQDMWNMVTSVISFMNLMTNLSPFL